MKSNIQIGVMGGAFYYSTEAIESAFNVGKTIAENNCLLITGATIGIPFAAILGTNELNGICTGISFASNAMEHVEKHQKPIEGLTGIVSIKLDRSFSRDINDLKQHQKNNYGTELILIVNDPCKLNCAIELEHDRLISEASISKKDYYYHYCSFSCISNFINNPEVILKSTFIRPEDLHFMKI